MSVGDAPFGYMQGQMGTSIEGLFETSSGGSQDVNLTGRSLHYKVYY